MKINEWDFQRHIFTNFSSEFKQVQFYNTLFNYNYLYNFTDLSLLKEEATKLLVKNKNLEIELQKLSLGKIIFKCLAFIKKIFL